ncbi:CoA-binding protein [Candidatus Undinarchaeota archaeon]
MENETSISDLIEQVLDKKNIYAVVGVSTDSEKYGHKIFKFLLEHGYEVYPVNPNAEEVLGHKVYPDLKSLPKKPNVVDVVVPPHLTEKIVSAAKDLGIKMVWLQPGSESQKAIEFCVENEIQIIHGHCVMAEINIRCGNQALCSP